MGQRRLRRVPQRHRRLQGTLDRLTPPPPARQRSRRPPHRVRQRAWRGRRCAPSSGTGHRDREPTTRFLRIRHEHRVAQRGRDTGLQHPRALHVPAGEGLTEWVSGDIYEIKATAEATNGALSFIDARIPPGNGPVAHVHSSRDELFYIISGELELLNGYQTFIAEAGAPVFVPRGTRHRFRNVSDEETHMVFLFTPGGVETMFVETCDDPVPGEQPQFWSAERFMSVASMEMVYGFDPIRGFAPASG
ncbi:cupin domain-containing protein [Streptomyces sp. NPDC058256]|uniref:cupin domain-containing protein n=1 Tax=Streptomyces sp. NPDC058256 TaxID=3346408 RepID=UPI0036E8196F